MTSMGCVTRRQSHPILVNLPVGCVVVGPKPWSAACPGQCGHMETGVVLQHDDTPRECEGMLSLIEARRSQSVAQ